MAPAQGNPGAPDNTPGMTETPSFLTFDGFAGLNTKPTRPAIEDQEMFWCDNFMPLGKNNLQVMYDVGPAIYTATSAGSVEYINFANFGSTAYGYVFLDDGSIVQVDVQTSVTTTIAGAGTIIDPEEAIGFSQWAGQYVLIAAPQDNGYFVWDNTNFYEAGTLGPIVTMLNDGLDYTGIPTMAAFGGAGSGATFTATVTNGSVTNVKVTSPGSGYTVNDVVIVTFTSGGSNTTATATASISGGAVTSIHVSNSGTGYTGTTLIAIQGGGGTGATATVSSLTGGHIASIAVGSGGEGYTSSPTVIITDANNPVAQAVVNIMPFGISGTNIEVYASRVWIANGDAPTDDPPRARVLFSAPSNPVDFSAADGAGAFVSTDSFLRIGIHALKQSNGFLYLVADSSDNYISGVTTSGSPPVTTFNNQNIDPQVGSPWPNSVVVYSRAVMLANSFGVHAIYGGAVQKVSDQLDGIYPSVPVSTFNDFVPSAAVCIMFGVHVYVLLYPIIDPITGLQRNCLFCWDGKKWWTSTQSVEFIQIATQEVNSVMTCYGTDGTSIYPLFQTPSTTLLKQAQSKQWIKPGLFTQVKPTTCYGLVQPKSDTTAIISVNIDADIASAQYPNINTTEVQWINNFNDIVQWTNNSGQIVEWVSIGTNWFYKSVNALGMLVGFTIYSTSEDFSLVSLALTNEDYTWRV